MTYKWDNKKPTAQMLGGSATRKQTRRKLDVRKLDVRKLEIWMFGSLEFESSKFGRLDAWRSLEILDTLRRRDTLWTPRLLFSPRSFGEPLDTEAVQESQLRMGSQPGELPSARRELRGHLET